MRRSADADDRAPRDSDEWEDLFEHLQRKHEVTSDAANEVLNKVQHLHEIGLITHAAGFRFRDLDLRMFPADDPAGKQVLERLRKWWRDEGGGIYLYGPVGTGHTGLRLDITASCSSASARSSSSTPALLAEMRSELATGGQADL